MHPRIVNLAVGFVALALLSPLAGPTSAQQHDHDHGPTLPSGHKRWVTPVPAHRMPPVPYQGYPPQRPMPVVQEAYAFAGLHPEILSYIPCFCGCERSAGHTGNQDCFVLRRDAEGRVLEWNPHGYSCAICIDVARDAMQMFNAGASRKAIRSAIDAKYIPHFSTTTPTPKPPA